MTEDTPRASRPTLFLGACGVNRIRTNGIVGMWEIAEFGYGDRPREFALTCRIRKCVSNSHKEGFPIEEQWPSTTNCLCFTLYPRPLGKRSAFIGRLCQSSCAHKSRETGFLECGGWVCWIEQTSKAPEGIRDQGKRQNNLRTTSDRMRHPHSALSYAGIYAQSRLPKRKGKYCRVNRLDGVASTR